VIETIDLDRVAPSCMHNVGSKSELAAISPTSGPILLPFLIHAHFFAHLRSVYRPCVHFVVHFMSIYRPCAHFLCPFIVYLPSMRPFLCPFIVYLPSMRPFRCPFHVYLPSMRPFSLSIFCPFLPWYSTFNWDDSVAAVEGLY